MQTALTESEYTAFFRVMQSQADEFGVRIRLAELHDFARVDRGGENRIFDPSRQDGPAVALLAERSGQVIATWACTVFDTGRENMADYLKHTNLYRDDGRDGWLFEKEALDFAAAMHGTICYCGGLWAHPDHRGEGKFGRWWSANAGLVGRAYAMKMWSPDWFWLISDFGGVAEKVAHRYCLKQLAKEVDWLVDGRSYDGRKVMGVQDRSHLIQSVRERLSPSHR